MLVLHSTNASAMLVHYYTIFLVSVTVSITQSINVQGPIFAETVWEAKDGPFVLTGDFQIPDNVALIIRPGTQVVFSGDFQILVKGRVDIQGTRSKPIEFIGGNGRKPMLIFKSNALSKNTISYVHFVGPQTAIQLASESEHNQDSVKNQGTLEVNNIVVINSKIQTNGYNSGALLTIRESNINNSTVVGVYPRSEFILIEKSIIDGSVIRSDSYNYGIKINGSTVRSTEFTLGCCSANIEVVNSRLTGINIREGDGNPVNGPLNFTSSNITGLNVNLPSAKSSFKASRIRLGPSDTIILGSTNVRCSTFTGNQTAKGLQITGLDGYYPSTASQQIVQSTFSNFDTAITVAGEKTALTIDRSNFIRNTQYNIYTTSPKDIMAKNNYWGVNRLDLARGAIYDYYRNIEYGQVITDPISTSRISNDDC